MPEHEWTKKFDDHEKRIRSLEDGRIKLDAVIENIDRNLTTLYKGRWRPVMAIVGMIGLFLLMLWRHTDQPAHAGQLQAQARTEARLESMDKATSRILAELQRPRKDAD